MGISTIYCTMSFPKKENTGIRPPHTPQRSYSSRPNSVKVSGPPSHTSDDDTNESTHGNTIIFSTTKKKYTHLIFINVHFFHRK